MHPTPTQLSLLVLSWLGYFISHSIFASLQLKRFVADRFPRYMPAYRLCFNLLAIILLLIPLGLMHAYQGPLLWQWQGIEKIISYALRFAAFVAVIWTLKYYDGSEIIGLRQIKHHEQSVEDQEHFHISPFHRFVRHPWYFLSLLYIWAGEMDMAWLVSAIMLSLYFIIGSRFEERKLLAYHGGIYRRYRLAVPGLIPLPWRYLTPKQAQALLDDNQSSSTYG